LSDDRSVRAGLIELRQVSRVAGGSPLVGDDCQLIHYPNNIHILLQKNAEHLARCMTIGGVSLLGLAV